MAGEKRSGVLYVEDLDVNVMLMREIVRRRPDLKVVVAPNCERALRAVRLFSPSLLLLDIHLPDGHGPELLKSLRKHLSRRAVPAIAVTSDAGFDLRGSGFDGLWRKPLSPEQALAGLGALITPACGSRT